MELWAENAGSIYLQTFSHVTGDKYEVASETFFNVTVGFNQLNVSGVVNYQSGDYIGWTTTNPSVISYDYNNIGEEVTWSPGNNQFVLGVGNTLEFPGIGDDNSRTYSISADIAPVPEPATMLLFGLGILGLAGVSRKKLGK